jgi:hypothetical protein
MIDQSQNITSSSQLLGSALMSETGSANQFTRCANFYAPVSFDRIWTNVRNRVLSVFQRNTANAALNPPITHGADPLLTEKKPTHDLKGVSTPVLDEHLARMLGTNDLSALKAGCLDDAQWASVQKAVSHFGLQAKLIKHDEHGKLPEVYQKMFDEIFVPTFPPAEAVPVDTIKASLLQRQKDNKLEDGKRFSICFTDRKGNPIGFLQGGTPSCGDNKVFSFGEYWAVKKGERDNGMLSVKHALQVAISNSVAKKEGKEVAGLVWEMEYIGSGEKDSDKVYTQLRADKYNHAGGLVIAGIRNGDGNRHPWHVQPNVTKEGKDEDTVASMALVIRPMQEDGFKLTVQDVKGLTKGYGDYFNHWGQINEKHGLDGTTVNGNQLALEQRLKKLESFDKIELIPAAKSPTVFEMAKYDPVIAGIVMQDYGITGKNVHVESDRMKIAKEAEEEYKLAKAASDILNSAYVAADPKIAKINKLNWKNDADICLEPTAKLMAKAFLDEPLAKYMEPNEELRLKMLEPHFKAVIEYYMSLGAEMHVTRRPDGEIIGAIIVEQPKGSEKWPSEAAQNAALEKLMTDLQQAYAQVYGKDRADHAQGVLNRYVEFVTFVDNEVAKVHKDGVVYGALNAIDPKYQRSGHGERQLARLLAAYPGHTVVFWTDTADALLKGGKGYYAKSGCEVVANGDCKYTKDDGTEIRFLVMTREPRDTSAA